MSIPRAGSSASNCGSDNTRPPGHPLDAGSFALHAERDHLVARIRGQRPGRRSELTGKVLVKEKMLTAGAS
jgi:hypothetical protein